MDPCERAHKGQPIYGTSLRARSPKRFVEVCEVLKLICATLSRTDASQLSLLISQSNLDSLAGETTAKAIKYTLNDLASGAKALVQAYEDPIKRTKSQAPARISLAKEALSGINIAK